MEDVDVVVVDVVDTNDEDRHDDSSRSQAEHCEQLDAPGEENCPLGQELHADAPAVALNEPAGHSAQGAPAVE